MFPRASAPRLITYAHQVGLQLHDGVVCRGSLDLWAVVADEEGLLGFDSYEAFFALHNTFVVSAHPSIASNIGCWGSSAATVGS